MVYYLTVFLSSFLIFTLEPLLGKKLLPLYGGGSQIWVTLMFFFILQLFGANLYANFLIHKNPVVQKKIHFTLLVISVLTLAIPILINFQNTYSHLNPLFSILLVAFTGIGFPFFILASTVPLIQSWFVLQHPEQDPYRLYGLSNFGALLGLISYPFLIEPVLNMPTQLFIWKAIYFAVTILLIYLLIGLPSKTSSSGQINPTALVKIPLRKTLYWFALALVPNLLLLSITTYITQGIPSLPLIWIIPLALYLVSFILAFNRFKWSSAKILIPFFLAGLIFLSLAQTRLLAPIINYSGILLLCLSSLFTGCLIFHRELYKARPPASSLTEFYLAIALGGVVASLICAFIAPTYFPDLWEVPLSLFTAICFIFFILYHQKFHLLYKLFLIILTMATGILVLYGFWSVLHHYESDLSLQRNFYGITKVTRVQNTLDSFTIYLFSGTISHGFQKENSPDSDQATSYYSVETGIGILLNRFQNLKRPEPLRIGVVGLGVGTLAAYCRPLDYFRFYEINPQIISAANHYFTFIKHCQDRGGLVDIVPGDARLSLTSELNANQPQNFDVLVIDAFTDDAIPIHLLTSEAVTIYLSHLSPGGILAFHITNGYLHLGPVLAAIAAHKHLQTFSHQSQAADWYLMSVKNPNLPPLSFSIPSVQNPPLRPWTDNYSNLLDSLLPLSFRM